MRRVSGRMDRRSAEAILELVFLLEDRGCGRVADLVARIIMRCLRAGCVSVHRVRCGDIYVRVWGGPGDAMFEVVRGGGDEG